MKEKEERFDRYEEAVRALEHAVPFVQGKKWRIMYM